MRCEIIFSNATVIDGTGTPSVVSDVAIESGRIAGIGDLSDWRSDERIEARGRVLAPGFIDVHTHDDLAALKTPGMAFKLSQGVTTVIAGNCGISAAPFTSDGAFPAPLTLLGKLKDFAFPSIAAYAESFKKAAPSVNLAMLTGHSSLRVSAMGDAAGERPASEAEIEIMAQQLRLALRQGSIGLSTGLDYPPARPAPADEVTALARVLAEEGQAVYTSHIRNEGDQVLEALEEAVGTGSSARVRTIISHHKCAGPKNYGRSVETLALIEKARAAGVDIAFDVYPYTASSTSLMAHFARDAATVLVAHSDPHPEVAGKYLSEICAEWVMSDAEVAEKLHPASAIYFQMDEGDLRRIMSHPLAMIGSDGLPGTPNPHPRLWGTFPRVLGHFSRDEGLFPLETAIHKMTDLSAQTFGLKERGRISEDYIADLVLFNPDEIADMATYEAPEKFAKGIECVVVGGDIAYADGEFSNTRNGRFISRLAH